MNVDEASLPQLLTLVECHYLPMISQIPLRNVRALESTHVSLEVAKKTIRLEHAGDFWRLK